MERQASASHLLQVRIGAVSIKQAYPIPYLLYQTGPTFSVDSSFVLYGVDNTGVVIKFSHDAQRECVYR
jgi:hypothetical protein